jgi:hypothetical protein
MRMQKIPDFENYFAGEDGRIYRRNKNCFRQLGQFIQPYGKYLSVYLYQPDGNKIGVQVHKLIASAFFNADIRRVSITHKDNNLLNNSPDNLLVAECNEISPNDDEEAKCNIIKIYENLLLKQLNYDTNSDIWKKYNSIKSNKNKRSVYNWLYVNIRCAS